MTEKLKHRHWPVGWLRCLLRPCGVSLAEETRRMTYVSFADRKAELRAAVQEERDRLYAMIDNGADVDDDPLLAHIAASGRTLRGEIRRVPRGERRTVPSGEIRADVETAEQRRLRLLAADREALQQAHRDREEQARRERLARLRRGEL